ncbi:trypsin-like peptidase domain-containing protein [Sphingobium sufflavum]|uniref:S1C family serine protease n=1 Tax=Sphingobium sufflavum TaxID=1129547 RepID=UPI001F25A91A|nr:trypsin-like peptidase domain-containing protein [Sphingobium sufflavum]MCE7797722.1 trypsin-like peptidase domain-containing protein [Sphingobium sufflavum]
MILRLGARTLALLSLALVGAAQPAHADSQDIAAASRSVVRVALVATKGDGAYFVGHGSGIVVAPNKVLTNAHVVELVRDEPNIVIGVVPAEGKRSYGARIIAFSPGNDLALLEISGGTLPPATLFANATQDGQGVVAIGYPGNVDRAQGMVLSDIIQPMTPVKTQGAISTGRSSKQYDTVLHTAPMAAGNSGGPLVDLCGRVLGVNSFGSVSDGNDAEYGFAVSNREVSSFLRQAGVQPLRTIIPCRSLAETDAAEKNATEKARLEADARAAADADSSRERAMRARQDAEQSIIVSRENFIAVAAVLLALALVCAGGAGIAKVQGRPKQLRNFAIGAAVLLIGALTAFFLRPSFSEVDDRAAAIVKELTEKDRNNDGGATVVSGDALGTENICRIDLDRSRVTVSDTADVTLGWTRAGCINGKTQLVQNGATWGRVLVPNDEPSAAIRTIDPATGTYRSENYALDAATAEAARKARASVDFAGCTTEPAKLETLTRLEAEIRALLPPEPNERLVYRCTPGKAPPAP